MLTADPARSSSSVQKRHFIAVLGLAGTYDNDMINFRNTHITHLMKKQEVGGKLSIFVSLWSNTIIFQLQTKIKVAFKKS